MTQATQTIAPSRSLIIAGVTRAGTTSLFNYLADHPQVRGSTIKETRFFMDEDYPLQRLAGFEHGVDGYGKFFPSCPSDLIQLEATPDYLYCQQAPQRIRDMLPAVQLVFILREPVERLVSWFHYSRQRAKLAAAVTFDQYVQMMHKIADQPKAAQHMCALDQGRYTRYLKPWLEMFEQHQPLVLDYATLRDRPLQIVQAICRALDVDEQVYEGYDFQVHNESQHLKRPGLYRMDQWLNRRLKPLVHDWPSVRAPLRWARKSMRSLVFENLGHRSGLLRSRPTIEMSPATRQIVAEYYEDEPDAVARLTGLDTQSWKTAADRLVIRSGRRRVSEPGRGAPSPSAAATGFQRPRIDLMIAGAQKAGTSSLLSYLAQHHQICTHRDREFTFFINDEEYARGYDCAFDTEFSHYESNQSNVRIVTKNVGVMDEPAAADRLAAHNPNVHCAFLLRNPVDRAYSAFWYARRRGWELLESFDEAIEAGSGCLEGDQLRTRDCAYLRRGLYAEHLKRFYEALGPQHVAVFLVEDLKSDALAVCRQLFELLDVDATFEPNVTAQRNRAAIARSDTLARMMASQHTVKRVSRMLMPYRLRLRTKKWLQRLNEKPFVPPSMNQQIRQRLIEYYRPHNEQLTTMIGRDLSHWNQ